MDLRLAVTVSIKKILLSSHGGKKRPGELEREGVIEGTHRGYRHGCHGCMPMRNQSHHHSVHHYRENGREVERQGDKDGVSLKWSHTLFTTTYECRTNKERDIHT